MSGEERLKRLRELAGMIELELGPDWMYVCLVGKFGADFSSINMISNGPPAEIEKLFAEIAARVARGEKHKPL
jgi:hypothetical protein